MFWRMAPYVVGFGFGWLATRLWVALDRDYLEVWIQAVAVAAVFLTGVGLLLKWGFLARPGPGGRPPEEARGGDRPPGPR